MIHFAHPGHGKALCSTAGDIRWMKGKWVRSECCILCWHQRIAILGALEASKCVPIKKQSPRIRKKRSKQLKLNLGGKE